jgi:tetratricopeptide (TPR) repeat protein
VPRPRAGLVMICLLLAMPIALAAQRINLLVPMSELAARAVRDSNDPVAHYEFALGLLLASRFDEAEHELKTAIEVEPHFAAGYLALSMVPFARQPRLWEVERITEKTRPEIVQALTESRRLSRIAFMLDPMVDLKVFAVILPAQGKVGGGSGDLYNTLLLGFEQFWVGNYGEAAHLFTQLVESVPERDRGKKMPSFIYWLRGLAAAHQGDYAVAVADFELLLDRAVTAEREAADSGYSIIPFSASNQFRYVLGTVRAKSGAWESAVALLQQCLENDLGLYPAHSALAAIYETRRMWAQAEAERQRALAASPEDVGLLLDLGATLVRSGDFSLALDPLRRAMDANPRNPRIPYLLGQAALRVFQRDVAKAAFERFLSLAPSKFASQIQVVRQQVDSLAAAATRN